MLSTLLVTQNQKVAAQYQFSLISNYAQALFTICIVGVRGSVVFNFCYVLFKITSCSQSCRSTNFFYVLCANNLCSEFGSVGVCGSTVVDFCKVLIKISYSEFVDLPILLLHTIYKKCMVQHLHNYVIDCNQFGSVRVCRSAVVDFC